MSVPIWPPGAPPAVPGPRWGAEDEARHNKLVAELRELQQRRAAAADAVAAVFGRLPRTYEAYIKHADEIRDALAPFDSGVRCADEVPK